jgi:hypothetical protein
MKARCCLAKIGCTVQGLQRQHGHISPFLVPEIREWCGTVVTVVKVRWFTTWSPIVRVVVSKDVANARSRQINDGR